MVGPVCAGVSPGKTLCAAASVLSAGCSEGVSCESLSGARVATSLSAMVLLCEVCCVDGCAAQRGSKQPVTYARGGPHSVGGVGCLQLASTTQRETRFDASSELRCAATLTQHPHNRLNRTTSNMAEQAITQGAIRYAHLIYLELGDINTP